MEVRMARKAGFCYGVKRAIELACASAREGNGPVYSLGPLIHNPQVVARLEMMGIKEIQFENLNEITQGTLLIRSHGVGPDVFKTAGEKGLQVVDATCPFVRRAQAIARNLVDKGYQVMVVGDRRHPEVQGIADWTFGKAIIVENQTEIGQVNKFQKIGVVAQTTQPQENFASVVSALRGMGAEVAECNTICSATAERQQAARELAGQVDLMIVVGGHNSANTRKLASLCRDEGTATHHIESVESIDPAWFRGVKTAGVTAGASTPDWIIEEVRERMSEFVEKNGQEEDMKETEEEVLQEAAAEERQDAREDLPEEAAAGQLALEDQGEVAAEAEAEVEMVVEEEMAADEDLKEEEGMKEAVEVKAVRHGDLVRGTVVYVGQDEVMVDVGAKSEGIIPIRELSCYDVSSPHDVVKVGDEIEVYVLKAEDNEGRLVLSKEKADAERAWAELEGIMEAQEPVSGKVREVVKGGLLVDLGVRAFLPASLVERGYVEDLSKYLGEEITAQVIEMNRARKKVILSRKTVLEEEHVKQRQEMLDTIQEGQVVQGTVRRLTQFGAFVDIGGIDGLLHISEMSWHRINHPSEVVKVDDELEVKVLKVDRENEKISLGLKQVLPNPWDNVETRYPVGSIVKAKVVRLAPFGAFVQLEPGVEGLVHISHLSDRHVAKPDEVVSEGEEVNVKVLSIDQNEKRIRLSIREVPVPKKEQAQEYREEDKNTQDTGEMVTIGDMFGDLFEKKE